VKKNCSISRLLLTFIILGICLSGNLAGSARKEKNRFNLLLITIDTLRTDRLSCYSKDHLRTPNIDSLAGRGVLFTRAFAHTSTTLPSHTNILLGTTPLHHGVHDNLHFIVRQDFLSLAEHLKTYNYSTGAFIGAFPLDTRFGLSQGFDVYDDEYDLVSSKAKREGERKAEIVVGRALSWLQGQASPWFLWIHCWDPHNPYDPPEPYKTRFSRDPYSGEVAYVDSVLGKLFSHLDRNDLWNKTVVVFTGDHGESLGEHDEETHGIFAYNSTTWIPLIFSVPGIKPRKTDPYVAHIDIFPTVCDALDIEKPDSLQGVSLWPAIRGRRQKQQTIFFESLYPFYSRGWAPMRGFIRDQKRFIESPIPEIYDLEEDFGEEDNLAERTSPKDLNEYRDFLKKIIEDFSLDESALAEQKLDKRSLEQLKSLGYIADSDELSSPQAFGPDQDAKVLIHYHNKCIKAIELHEDGKTVEAIRLLKEVLAERDDIGIAFKTLADIYEEMEKEDDAIQTLEQGLESVPAYYEIVYTYVTSLLAAGRYDDVIQVVKTHSMPQMEVDPEMWNFVGLAHWNLGHFEEARIAYERSIALDKKYPIPYFNLGALFFSQFQETKKKDIHERALAFFKEAIALDPLYEEAHRGLGVAYLGVQNFDDAIGCFFKVLELKPDSAQAMFYLGYAYREKGDKDSACRFFYSAKSSPFYSLLSAGEKARLERWLKECSPTER
jgi:arylsulfatase A-like enzyme/Flp pilus assembly protein TadD